VIPAVEVRSLAASYGPSPVLVDVSFAVPAGTATAIVGPNGAGKSTLLKAMLGLIPSRGTVAIHGKPYAAYRLAVAYVPQRTSVDWDFPTTVFDVVLMGTYGRLNWFRRPGAAERAIAKSAIEKLGLADLAGRQIGELSGGQQQRTFLARALAQQADVLLLDEPLQGVDAPTESAIVAILHELRSQGRTILCVHHDLMTASTYFDRAILLNRTPIAAGPTAEALSKDNLDRAYGRRA
jgi:manganese/zinc/iron transport system ATP- binding protein